MTLTRAERNALLAVKEGCVVRVYDANGNVLKGPPGVGSNVLWRLFGKALIEDGPDKSGGIVRRVTQVLTKAGREALTSAYGTAK